MRQWGAVTDVPTRLGAPLQIVFEMRRATDQIVRPDRNGHLVTLRGQDWQPEPALVGDPE